MERQPYPPRGSCVAKNSQRPASVETVQGGVPPYGVKYTLVVNGKLYADDLVILAPSVAGLSKLLSICEIFGESNDDIIFNQKKSACFICISFIKC